MDLRPTQGNEQPWWRELQLAASASAGGSAAIERLSLKGPRSHAQHGIAHPSGAQGV